MGQASRLGLVHHRPKDVGSIFAAAAEAVLDLYEDMTAGPDSDAVASLFDEETCIELILANARLLRPDFATSQADRLALQPYLDGVSMCFTGEAILH